jgi:hypothetical protein
MERFDLAPLLTERDPVDSGEGGINPLGTEALADALAVRLAPGVRERQRRPRFLTAMAVSLGICRDSDEEAVAGHAATDEGTPRQMLQRSCTLIRTNAELDSLSNDCG